ncbi:hypothetical protein [Pseudomonas nitroreducens]|uniref:hypothetical protein n=1 Tax=Pseudomonas nitroreducens TaxID=46680 RepID=UPI0009FEA75F|nr:hypothetical protein [Pseudomonas nitroreducens]NMZ58322.1 hypothetical protein [Pseudomonas nitroreducens]SNS15766.1 hypothetical protein SAMN05216209_1552 [Pseudomonas nitroreducens]
MLRFIKTTIAGGLLFILPLVLIVILVEKAIHLLSGPLQKVLARLLGEDFFSAKCANNVRKYLERNEAPTDNGPSTPEHIPSGIREDRNSTMATVTEPQ